MPASFCDIAIAFFVIMVYSRGMTRLSNIRESLTGKGQEAKSKLIKTTAVVALGIAALTGCDNGNAAPAVTPTATEAQATTQAPTPTIESPAPTNSEVLTQTKSIEEMKAMDVDTFVQLPIADRLAFAIDVWGSAYPAMDPNNDWSQSMPEGIAPYFWQAAENDSLNNADPNVIAKLTSVDRYYTTTLDGQIDPSLRDTIANYVANGGEGIGGNTQYTGVANGAMQKGADRDGKPIEFMNVTYTVAHGGGTVEKTQTTQAIRTEIKLQSGKTVVWFFKGYTIDGQQSPDSKYPY
jgi:hypothetical protein